MNSKLWIDSCKPFLFKDLDFNYDVNVKLEKLATDNMPNMIFYGQEGSGKKTRLYCLLNKLLNNNKKLDVVKEIWISKKLKDKEVPIISSKIHVEIYPSDFEGNDRIIISEFIKNMVLNRNIMDNNLVKYLIIVIHEPEKLSFEAQGALRRILEKFSNKSRFIFISENISKIMPAIRSRLLNIRFKNPNNDELFKILRKVSLNNQLNYNENLAKKIVNINESNLYSILIKYQIEYYSSIKLITNKEQEDYQQYIEKFVKNLLNNRNTEFVHKNRLYDLVSNCIPGNDIIRLLIKYLFIEFNNIANINNLEKLKSEIIKEALKTSTMMSQGSDEIYFLEYFIISILDLLNKYSS